MPLTWRPTTPRARTSASGTPWLGDDDIGGERADAGDGADQLPERTKAFDHLLDQVGKFVDRRSVLVDELQVRAHQHRVVIGKAALQRLDQLRDLAAQRAARHLDEHDRITRPVGKGVEHVAPGQADDARGQGGQFDAGVFEDLSSR